MVRQAANDVVHHAEMSVVVGKLLLEIGEVARKHMHPQCQHPAQVQNEVRIFSHERGGIFDYVEAAWACCDDGCRLRNAKQKRHLAEDGARMVDIGDLDLLPHNPDGALDEDKQPVVVRPGLHDLAAGGERRFWQRGAGGGDGLGECGHGERAPQLIAARLALITIGPRARLTHRVGLPWFGADI